MLSGAYGPPVESSVPGASLSLPSCLLPTSRVTSDLNFPAFAGADLVDRYAYLISPKPNPGPSRRHEYQYRHLSGRQVLLIAEVLIGRDEEFVTILFRPIEQGAIPQLRPSSFEGRIHTVLRQVTPKRYRSSLIKQDLHEATVSASSPSS